MDARAAVSRYKSEAIESAPPVKIVRLLYEGAMRFLDQAAQIDPKTEGIRFREKLSRAQAIVTELRIALDHEQGSDVSLPLEQLYLFVEQQILRAWEDYATDAITNAHQVLATLHDAWRKVEIEPSPGTPPRKIED
ncbi:MAG: flagellar export chaperone FliS [Planctomycetota bacterium]|nr:flagellar export chaperone FliS [Planctomycetota bacterium]